MPSAHVSVVVESQPMHELPMLPHWVGEGVTQVLPWQQLFGQLCASHVH